MEYFCFLLKVHCSCESGSTSMISLDFDQSEVVCTTCFDLLFTRSKMGRESKCIGIRTCCNPYFGRTLSPGVSILPQSWSESVTDDPGRNSRLACYTADTPNSLFKGHDVMSQCFIDIVGQFLLKLLNKMLRG
ncbi:hypothetical protein EG68_05416 [Paragonimus skrjabini miyazakii]|uniref:Uncharacterized protein n=1 Tax=Paragonimus skrjabini miyazakii TaxID=59628 RepID=A0A8S9YSR0_9TREM|nr:hypothetical protein EG68_05416 [Paragonimus skrjabini miyazakii]